MIFIHMLLILSPLIVFFAIFWSGEEIGRYRKDVYELKKNFIIEKNKEIKNIILEFKSYIHWVRYNPEEAMASYMKRQADSLRSVPGSESPLGHDGDLLPGLKKAIGTLRIPLWVFNDEGKPVYHYSPFGKQYDGKPDIYENELMDRIMQNPSSEAYMTLYDKWGKFDSAMLAGGYYSTEVLKGCKVISLVGRDKIEPFIQFVIIDSISRWQSQAEEYIFINTTSGYALLNKRKIKNPPEDILTSDDRFRESVFRCELLAVGHPEGIYYTYEYTRLNSADTVLKTAFFSFLPRWNWIIGTGYYHDEVQHLLTEQKQLLYAKLIRGLLYVGIYFLVSLLVSHLLARFFSRHLDKDLAVFDDFFKKAAAENIWIDASAVKFDEIAIIADQANEMVERRAAAEKKLAENRAKLDAALESMSEAVFIADTAGNFVDFNEAFASMHKFKSKEQCPHHFQDYPAYLDFFYMDGNPRPLDQWAVPRALRGESGNNVEFIVRRKDTGETWIGSYNFGPIRDENGVIAGAVVTARDVTEQKKAADEIRKLNEELEGKVAMRTTQLDNAIKELQSFTYSISHDLRAPLRAINGFSQIINRRYRETLTREGQHYLDYIIDSSNRMDHLINDLLTYSRLGMKPVVIHPVSLQEIIDHVVTDFQYELEPLHGNITIEKELPVIMGDESLLGQIFSNLVGNAIKYRQENIPPDIKIDWKKDKSNFIITVTDNGIGMEEEHLEKIFSVFQRLHGEGKYPGTGIGLASVRKAVTRLGGEVRAASSVGQGSVFTIKLPIKPEISVLHDPAQDK